MIRAMNASTHSSNNDNPQVSLKIKYASVAQVVRARH